MYPMMKDAIAKMNAEGGKIDGTAILTTTTMDAVKSAEQVAEEAKASSSSGDSKSATPPAPAASLEGSRRSASKKMGGDEAVQAARDVHDGDERSPESGHRRDARRRRDPSRVQGKQVTGFMVQGSGPEDDDTFALMLMMMSAALTAQAPAAKKPASESAAARAARIHKEAIVVDTHIDTTMMLGREGWDFMVRHQPTKGEDSNHVDLPRAREGGSTPPSSRSTCPVRSRVLKR